MACGLKNGNKDSPVDFGADHLKIMVIGEPKCGKTTFIRECVRNNFPLPETSINGVRVYQCEFEVSGEQRPVALYEIPSHPGFVVEQRVPHYEKADIFVFMYAIDDPSSFEMLVTKWIPEAHAIINAKVLPVAILGNKKDLLNNPQVLERLALNNQSPVAPEQTQGLFGANEVQSFVALELSSSNPDDVLQAFINICDLLFGVGIWL